jgi:hypothetical protein
MPFSLFSFVSFFLSQQEENFWKEENQILEDVWKEEIERDEARLRAFYESRSVWPISDEDFAYAAELELELQKIDYDLEEKVLQGWGGPIEDTKKDGFLDWL